MDTNFILPLLVITQQCPSFMFNVLVHAYSLIPKEERILYAHDLKPLYILLETTIATQGGRLKRHRHLNPNFYDVFG